MSLASRTIDEGLQDGARPRLSKGEPMKRNSCILLLLLSGAAGAIVLAQSLKDNWEVVRLEGPKPYLLITKIAPNIEVSRAPSNTLMVAVIGHGKPWVPVSWELTKDSIKTSCTTQTNGEEITVYDDDGDGIPDRRLTLSMDPKTGKVKTVTVEKLKSIEWEVVQKKSRKD
jgi:hypothetical protein